MKTFFGFRFNGAPLNGPKRAELETPNIHCLSLWNFLNHSHCYNYWIIHSSRIVFIPSFCFWTNKLKTIYQFGYIFHCVHNVAKMDKKCQSQSDLITDLSLSWLSETIRLTQSRRESYAIFYLLARINFRAVKVFWQFVSIYGKGFRFLFFSSFSIKFIMRDSIPSITLSLLRLNLTS